MNTLSALFHYLDTLFLSSFITRSLMAGVLLAPSLAISGCFLLWRRMAFLADTLGHGAILGIAVGLLIHMDAHLSVLLVALLLGGVLSRHPQNHLLPLDTWMSIISYSSLALGLILLSFNREKIVDPDTILFGDILAISTQDLLWVFGLTLTILLLTFKNWRIWLLMTFDEELSITSGIPLEKHRLLFVIVVAMVIAIGMKMIGALLLPALMIIPVATVVRFSKSPEQMVLLATLVTLLSYFLGFTFSFEWDLPTGPAIVITATALFLGSTFISLFKKKNPV